MDGVLIDSEPVHYEATVKYLNGELGLAFNREENLEFLGRSDEYMFRILQKRYDLPYPVPQMIERRCEIYLELLTGKVALMPGVVKLIRDLKEDGYRLAVASSSLNRVIDTILREGEIAHYFEVIQSGEHLPYCKPRPEIFLMAAAGMKIAPGRCAVIEDTTVGIEAARAAGMLAIAYAAPGAAAQDFSSADIVIQSFADVNLRRALRS